MTSYELLEAALSYASQGIEVVPLWPKGKVPLDFCNHSPTTDTEIIKRWWKICPTANIGIPTGTTHNSLIVLDLDVSCGINGEKTLTSICQKNSIHLPDTSIVRTGSTGFHLYFKNSQRIIVRGGKNFAPGVDVRAEGALVVAPPSIHKNGNQYYWLRGGIDRLTPADENLYKLLHILECNKL